MADEIISLDEMEKETAEMEIRKGRLTNNGVVVDGQIEIQRAQDQRFKKLTIEQQMTLDRWTLQAMKDYPNLEKFYVESIMYKCIIDPEGSEKYAKDNYHKLYEAHSGEETFTRIENENDNVSFYK